MALQKLRQEEDRFRASLAYKARPYLKKTKKVHRPESIGMFEKQNTKIGVLALINLGTLGWGGQLFSKFFLGLILLFMYVWGVVGIKLGSPGRENHSAIPLAQFLHIFIFIICAEV